MLTHGLDWPGRASVFQRPPGSVCHLEVPEGGGLLLTTNLPAPTKRYALAMEICIGVPGHASGPQPQARDARVWRLVELEFLGGVGGVRVCVAFFPPKKA